MAAIIICHSDGARSTAVRVADAVRQFWESELQRSGSEVLLVEAISGDELQTLIQPPRLIILDGVHPARREVEQAVEASLLCGSLCMLIMFADEGTGGWYDGDHPCVHANLGDQPAVLLELFRRWTSRSLPPDQHLTSAALKQCWMQARLQSGRDSQQDVRKSVQQIEATVQAFDILLQGTLLSHGLGAEWVKVREDLDRATRGANSVYGTDISEEWSATGGTTASSFDWIGRCANLPDIFAESASNAIVSLIDGSQVPRLDGSFDLLIELANLRQIWERADIWRAALEADGELPAEKSSTLRAFRLCWELARENPLIKDRTATGRSDKVCKLVEAAHKDCIHLLLQLQVLLKL